MLKVQGSICSKLSFVSFVASLQRCNFQISVEAIKLLECTKQFCILQLPISYCVGLIMATITKHIFINIFQMKQFSAVKFAMGYEKNMSFLMIAKSPQVWKKVEKIGLGFFQVYFRDNFLWVIMADFSGKNALTGGNWQKWKRVFLTCPCHKIYRDEAVGFKSCKYTWKITKFVKMGNLGQYRENLIFCQ